MNFRIFSFNAVCRDGFIDFKFSIPIVKVLSSSFEFFKILLIKFLNFFHLISFSIFEQQFSYSTKSNQPPSVRQVNNKKNKLFYSSFEHKNTEVCMNSLRIFHHIDSYKTILDSIKFYWIFFFFEASWKVFFVILFSALTCCMLSNFLFFYRFTSKWKFLSISLQLF